MPPKQLYFLYFYNGIDRLDNTKGYTPENSVACCKHCNSLKGDRLTPEETKAAAEAIKRVREQKGTPSPTPAD